MEAMSRAEKMMRGELTRTLEMVGAPSAAEREMRPLPAIPTAQIRQGRIFCFGAQGDAGKEILLEVVAGEGLANDLIISALQECIDHLKGETGNVTATAP